VIPASIAWQTAATLLEHGRSKRGYLGIAGQQVELSDQQRGTIGRDHALLVIRVTSGSPAANAGMLVGDLLLDFDGHAIRTPEDLLDLLAGDRVGRAIGARVVRGNAVIELNVTIAERPTN
jgi:S1-C subfamily serine protease